MNRNSVNIFLKDPFRLFFPLAGVFLLLGCFYWMAFYTGLLSVFPKSLHAEAFIGGYLLYSIIGFLMTAVPRFTESSYATKIECGSAFILAILSLISILFFLPSKFWMLVFANLILLVIFAAKRLKKRKQNPPFTFIFIGLGLISGLAGSFLIFMHSSFLSLEFGKMLFYDTMVQALIIGVGGRLLPGIFGFTEIVIKQRQTYEQKISFLKMVPKNIYLLAFVFFVSFLLEFFIYAKLGLFLRAFVFSVFAFYYWKVHKARANKTKHTFFIKISAWSILLGSWLSFAAPMMYLISLKHLIYIGGYILLTLLIASRVTLAHSQKGLALENKFFPIGLSSIFILIAALTRSTAQTYPQSYISHLAYAAGILALAFLLWALIFLPIMLFKPQSE